MPRQHPELDTLLEPFRQVGGGWWDSTRLAGAVPIPYLSIEGTAARLELAAVEWGDVAAAGYFGNPTWLWER